MRVIIVGCGRVGALVAAELDQRGEHVTVIDTSPRAFNRLPQSFVHGDADGIRLEHIAAARRSAATGPTRTSCAPPAPSRPTCS